MLYWECKRRLNTLREFRQLVVTYIRGGGVTTLGRRVETPDSRAARDAINLRMGDAVKSCVLIGHSLTLYYSPPPVSGGLTGQINIVENLFQLDRFRIPYSKVLDLLDRAIGDYERSRAKLRRQSFNPFYWVWIGFTSLLSAPFSILTAAGFNGRAAEQSLLGKLIKAVEGFVLFLAALLHSLSLLGYETSLGHLIKLLKHH
jgi:hypothetical protein